MAMTFAMLSKRHPFPCPLLCAARVFMAVCTRALDLLLGDRSVSNWGEGVRLSGSNPHRQEDVQPPTTSAPRSIDVLLKMKEMETGKCGKASPFLPAVSFFG